jgi:hypothetical protein
MSFDRHEILKKHYAEEIREWKWDVIQERIERNARDEDCCETDGFDKYAYLYIGSVQCSTPSGKIYALWTSNQTRSDETKDQAWWEALEEVCEEHCMFIGSPEGASDDIFLCKRFEVEVEFEEEAA